ncbi:MAG: transketolase, partial [Selenomonadaceae bacterium]|nr:transketolase [Selenomonadaceae bacterium]
MRNASTEAVMELVRRDRNVIAVTADNGNEIYDEIKRDFPRQYIDYGIAECAMTAGAAGLAAAGKIPFIYAVTNFLSMRGYEFIRNIVCVRNYPVKFLGRSAGVVTGTYGMTHQGTEDLAVLRSLPDLLTITPSTPIMARAATKFAYRYPGAVYIRLEGRGEPEHYDETFDFNPGQGYVWREGSDAALICTGSIINEAMKAAEELKQCGIEVTVADMPTIRPLDIGLLLKIFDKVKYIFSVEEQTIYGGLGSAVAECMAEHGVG